MLEFIVKSNNFPNRRWFGESVKSFDVFIQGVKARLDSSIEVLSFSEISTLPEGADDRDNGNFILDPIEEKSGFDSFIEDENRVWNVIEKLQSFRKGLEQSIPMKKETAMFSGFGSSAGMQVLVPDMTKISKNELDRVQELINKFQEKQDFLVSFVSGE